MYGFCIDYLLYGKMSNLRKTIPNHFLIFLYVLGYSKVAVLNPKIIKL